MSRTLIIIPTYNEADNIGNILNAISELKTECDILVVDDNSPDGTARIVNAKIHEGFQNLHLLIRAKKEGLGKAYIQGFKWGLQHPNRYEYVFQMDADLSHDPKEIPHMLKLFQNGYDMVIGSRYLKGIRVINWPLGRIFLSVMASLYVRAILRIKIKDPTSGFVGYRRTVLSSIGIDDLRFVGYAFQIEMKYRVILKKFKFIEHPIIFLNRKLGESKMDSKVIKEAIFGVPYLRIKQPKFKENREQNVD